MRGRDGLPVYKSKGGLGWLGSDRWLSCRDKTEASQEAGARPVYVGVAESNGATSTDVLISFVNRYSLDLSTCGWLSVKPGLLPSTLRHIIWVLQVPYFNAPIYLQNKSSIGKVDEILGPINQVYFTIKTSEGVQATSFQSGDKVYIAGDKLLPLERFLPKPKPPPGTKSEPLEKQGCLQRM